MPVTKGHSVPGLREAQGEYAAAPAAEELMGARADLEQVRALLADAADGLALHFASIVRIARGLATELDGGGGPLAASAMRIAKEAESAVVGMQFQDLVDQLLAQTLARLDAVRDGIAGTDRGGYVAGAAMSPKAAEKGGTPRAHRIAQRSMAPGDIKLF